MTLGHLVQVDKELGVARAEVDMLWEEHGRVAVGVEGQHPTMGVAGLTILHGLANEPLEDGNTILQTLWMPLYTQYRLILRTLHGLDDAIVRAGDDTEAWACVVDSLVVEGVDFQSEE